MKISKVELFLQSCRFLSYIYVQRVPDYLSLVDSSTIDLIEESPGERARRSPRHFVQ